MPPGTPNILFIMADQLAAPLLKMHNPDSQIRTPHLDRLAANAVVFDSAYCPSPLCAPSRMSLVTGQLPSRIGSYDNAASIGSEVPTYAHYLRRAGYETALAGKMHFIGDQLHGYERRLTSDIYPGDFGWVVNWDDPDTRLEWYHNASSILQAGPCVRSNQLDYDEEVMYKSTQFLYDHVRQGPNSRPFSLTVSLTHPHDPYTIEQKYWDMYEDVDVDLPKVNIPKEEQDPHSKRLLKVTDLWDVDLSEDQVKKARRAYYGAVSYVDDCIGRILKVLKDCKLDENTIIVFSGDHGDMLGERGLWYKMSYFESSVRVPLLVHYPKVFEPRHVPEHVSTLDILPTLVDLTKQTLNPSLPLDGRSLYPLLSGERDDATVYAEYMGEGTIAPIMMIRRGDWKYITCPADPDQLYNLSTDPFEVHNLALQTKKEGPVQNQEIAAVLEAFQRESSGKWDFAKITEDVLVSQRQRLFVWGALKQGKFTSWDFNPDDDGREKYVRSHLPLDDLELRARYPPVDDSGRETRTLRAHQAAAFGE
ncbi:MAG: hypothetical protein M1818_000939 [Claussenomyces sp. TS43310]|nr:MAG: hypothetical protein M1818_000939 [Claussenomyces sp. TS43310]